MHGIDGGAGVGRAYLTCIDRRGADRKGLGEGLYKVVAVS